ncbi:Putative hydrolase [Hoyosella subflava DQS3-9A1]|uniref:Putative hydrolase n=1 Tax=Hoyosella subflava (strain DSM 45089 / JCM 17490 / NBRC 109087 / DQS3-9A1) TaxID=443218 RepID=F6EEX9_HOYSD|nr:Putative hydrolase [Hoyosella subflava DQS3-9A1]
MISAVDVQRRTVTNGDVSLAVFETGNPEGEPIVLVHGWPDTHELWQYVVPQLSHRFRVISYDTRGAGESTVPARVSDYELAALAADFYAVIDAVSPDAPVHVLAHDWGGVEVWEALATEDAASRVASFTVTSGPNLDILMYWVRDRLRRPTLSNLAGPLEQGVASYYTYLFQLPWLPELVLRRVMAGNWARFLGLFDGLDPARVKSAATIAEDMANGVNRYRANIARRLIRSQPKPTTVPVQVVINARDRAVRPGGYDDYGKFASQLWRRTIDSGHWSPISNPDDLVRATVEFIDMLSGSDPSTELAEGRVSYSGE